tara:strand:- start:124 stop:336 length:213 start_codon:yes stop_codon:yes gene_type:complete
MSKKNKVVSDLKKIIKIQEKIIKAKESEFQQVHKLFIHYLDKSTEGWSWYGKYYHAYNDLIKNLRGVSDE